MWRKGRRLGGSTLSFATSGARSGSVLLQLSIAVQVDGARRDWESFLQTLIYMQEKISVVGVLLLWRSRS